MGQAKQRGTPEQRKMQAIARDAVANKNFVDGVKNAEFEVCGSEPDKQVYRQTENVWICEDCCSAIKDPIAIMTIPNIGGEKCYKCDNIGKYHIHADLKCQSTEFTKVFKYKRVSALVSPTGKDMVVEMMMVKCLQCGGIKKVGQ